MFRSNSPLSRDQIARFAPSVLATEAHESRGERYAYIPTITVLDRLAQEGFLPYSVGQTRTRDAGRREFTKHLVRLRHASMGVAKVGDSIPEIVLVNSHDGTSSYQLSSGFFRLVCANGMVVGNVTEDIRVRHSGDVTGDVIEGCTRILDDIQIAQSRIADYQAITLSQDEQRVFATAALQLRWDEGKAPVVADSVLRPRRWEDNKPDLWTTFNRVQESLLKGGVRGRNANGGRMTTREVAGVNENVKLNKALWSLADGLAQLKEDQHVEAFAAAHEHAYAQ